jgi:hypothetical protein
MMPKTETESKVQGEGNKVALSKPDKALAELVAAKADKPWLDLRGKGRFHGNPEDVVVRVDEIDASG